MRIQSMSNYIWGSIEAVLCGINIWACAADSITWYNAAAAVLMGTMALGDFVEAHRR